MSKSYKSGLSLRYCASTLGFRAAQVFCDWVVPCVGTAYFLQEKTARYHHIPEHQDIPNTGEEEKGRFRLVICTGQKPLS